METKTENLRVPFLKGEINISEEKKSEMESVIKSTVRLLKPLRLDYNQSKYFIREVRDRLEVKKPLENKERKLPKFLTENEMLQFIQASYYYKRKFGCFIKTSFLSGLRVSEMTNLKIKHLLFDQNVIFVENGKGGVDRYVPVFPQLMQEIITHLAGRNKGYVWESPSYKKYTERRIEQVFKEICEVAKIQKIVTPHVCRHTYATMLKNRGLVLDDIQMLLGHKDPKTTRIYAKTALLPLQQRIMDLFGNKEVKVIENG